LLLLLLLLFATAIATGIATAIATVNGVHNPEPCLVQTHHNLAWPTPK
jgi:hypothetical protein